MTEIIKESLVNRIQRGQKSKTAQQASSMGLTYAGFGRYVDEKGAVKYIVQNGRLVPYAKPDDVQKLFNQAKDLEINAKLTKDLGKDNPVTKRPGSEKKTSVPAVAKKDPAKEMNVKAQNLRKKADTYKQWSKKRNELDKQVVANDSKKTEELHNELLNYYEGAFDQEQINALLGYISASSDGTNADHREINSFLYSGMDQTAYKDKQKQYYNNDQYVSHMLGRIYKSINRIDSAFEFTRTPKKLTVYTGLSSRYDPKNIEVGSTYIFRGYLSTSLDYKVANSSGFGHSVMIEIEVPSDSKGIYISGLDAMDYDEKEMLLPRNTHLQIVSGPHKMPRISKRNLSYGGEAIDDYEEPINVYKAIVVSDHDE